MYRNLSVASSLVGKVILFAESDEGVFSHTIIASSGVRVESDHSSMKVAAISVDTSIVVRGWYLSGTYDEIEEGLVEFENSSSTNNYPRYTASTSSGNITVIDDHGSHDGTPSGANMKVITESYGACVGVRHTSTSDGYRFTGWLIETQYLGNFKFASSGYKQEYVSGSGYKYYVDEANGFNLDNALVIYDLSLSNEIKITAVYEEIVTHTVSFNPNGGEGAPEAITIEDGQSVIIPDTVPTYGDAIFLGWSIAQDATSAEYIAGDTITPTEDITLYAVWEGVKPDEPDEPGGSTSHDMISYLVATDSIVFNPVGGALIFG